MGIENIANMIPSGSQTSSKILTASGLKPVANSFGRMFDGSKQMKTTSTQKSFEPIGSGKNMPTGIGSVSGRTARYTKCGWINPDISDIPNAYKVIVSSSALQTVVVGLLQEESTFQITSEWGSFIPVAGLQNDINSVSQFFSGRVLMTQALTRRIWKGTSPITISVNLTFESIVDTWSNVGLPIRALGQMILPGVMGVDVGKHKVPLLSAPGPSPFHSPELKKTLKATGMSYTPSGLLSGDRIHLKIGKFLSFPEVIVKRIVPTYANRFDSNGQPISAKCTVEFETYEIITKSGGNGKGLDSIIPRS